MNFLSALRAFVAGLSAWLTDHEDSSANSALEALSPLIAEGDSDALISEIVGDDDLDVESLSGVLASLAEFAEANSDHAPGLLALAQVLDGARSAMTEAAEVAAAEAAAAEAAKAAAKEALAKFRAGVSANAEAKEDAAKIAEGISEKIPEVVDAASNLVSNATKAYKKALLDASTEPPAGGNDETVGWVSHVNVAGVTVGETVPDDRFDEIWAAGMMQADRDRRPGGGSGGASSERRDLLSWRPQSAIHLSAAEMANPAAAGSKLWAHLNPQHLAAQAGLTNAATLSEITASCCDYSNMIQAAPPSWQDAGVDDYNWPTISLASTPGEGCNVTYYKPIFDNLPESFSFPDSPGMEFTAEDYQKFGWVPADGEKPCGQLPCLTTASCAVEANTECWEWSVERERFNQQTLQLAINASRVALARARSRRRFEQMSNLSIARTFVSQSDTGFGLITYVQLLAKNLIREYVSQDRFPQAVVWNMSIPFWFAQELVFDARLTVGDLNSNITFADIQRVMLAVSNVRLMTRREGLPTDFTEISRGGDGDPVRPTPEKATVMLWHDGAVAKLDGGGLTVGTMFDASLVRRNMKQSFEEEWYGLCLFGFEPVKLEIDACANGRNQADRFTVPCSEIRGEAV